MRALAFDKLERAMILSSYTPAAARLFVVAVVLLLLSCSSAKNSVNTRLDREMPKKIVWAWERYEDVRFLDPNEFGVAFLAQTIFLEKDRVTPGRRRQPLDVNPGTYLIAVTRIETNKDTFLRPTFDAAMVERTASLIRDTLSLPGIKAIQLDFDAVGSERSFYRSLMLEVREQLPPGTPLTMTALASWCASDAWFNDLPVDEAIPMVFVMGADSDKIRNFLRNGNDWKEPLCRGSYGVSVNEGFDFPMKEDRRMYYFKNSSWTSADLR